MELKDVAQALAIVHSLVSFFRERGIRWSEVERIRQEVYDREGRALRLSDLEPLADKRYAELEALRADIAKAKAAGR
jgi:hypothetical protein